MLLMLVLLAAAAVHPGQGGLGRSPSSPPSDAPAILLAVGGARSQLAGQRVPGPCVGLRMVVPGVSPVDRIGVHMCLCWCGR